MYQECIIIIGQTAGGKSDFALAVAQRYNGEIINADTGQLYQPLSIGVATPSQEDQSIVTHHGYSILSDPEDWDVVQYRSYLEKTVKAVRQKGKRPIIVGGSSFYIHSLFFPPAKNDFIVKKLSKDLYTWDYLNLQDPERARHIHPHDAYRIERALDIIHATGKQPSALKPTYNPLFESILIEVTRDGKDILDRIQRRVDIMLATGFIQEAKGLSDIWKKFVIRKGFIGYEEIINDFSKDLTSLSNRIALKTRQYAKKQRTFNKRLLRMVCDQGCLTMVVNLTLSSADLYLDQLDNLIQKDTSGNSL